MAASFRPSSLRCQYGLGTLMLSITMLATMLSLAFVAIPLFIEDYRIVSGFLHIHLTESAQQWLFHPAAPMGPMHETKVVAVRSLLIWTTLLFALGTLGIRLAWNWSSRVRAPDTATLP